MSLIRKQIPVEIQSRMTMTLEILKRAGTSDTDIQLIEAMGYGMFASGFVTGGKLVKEIVTGDKNKEELRTLLKEIEIEQENKIL
jgi:hypothetical protein